MYTINDPMRRAEATHANREAVVCGDVRRSYGELVERVRRVAGLLDSLTEPGDREAHAASDGAGDSPQQCAGGAVEEVRAPFTGGAEAVRADDDVGDPIASRVAGVASDPAEVVAGVLAGDRGAQVARLPELRGSGCGASEGGEREASDVEREVLLDQ